MSSPFDIWKMLAGIAFFLMAMGLMEKALRALAGRGFKLFLKKHTTNNFKAVGGGAIVTGLMQSSSVVNLLVLSMVGAGIIKMENGLALMLGSNLGSTFSSWLFAAFGFGFNIENFVLPVAGLAGTLMAFLNKDGRLYQWVSFLFSLAFLFVALGFIKSGMEALVSQTHLSAYIHYPLVVFVLLGMLLTAIVQSSSATLVLTLSALYTGAIPLLVATAIVLGSEVGTTLKLFLASAKGLASKKRLALGNFLFNIITVVVLFFLLQPVNQLITGVLNIKNNLFALVFFQTFVNFSCLVIFFPFLGLFGRYLTRCFTESEDESTFINKVTASDVDIALDALENETRQFIDNVIGYSLESFSIKPPVAHAPQLNKAFDSKTLSEKYEYLKQLHGEMHSFYLKLQKNTASKAETDRLEQLISAIRNSMYTAKSIRDAQHDLDQFRNSSNDTKYNFYVASREKTLRFYEQLLLLFKDPGVSNKVDLFISLYREVTSGYAKSLQQLYMETMADGVNEIEISTMVNFNRELYTSFKSVLFGVKDFVLTPEEAARFDSFPGFIR